MEINESEDTKLNEPSLGDSLDNLRLAETHSISDYECIDSSEALLDNLLESVEKDSTLTWSDKEAQNDQIDKGSTSNNNAKDSVETEKSKSFFHLSDNMKKDLSMLAFPSKGLSRKKGIISSRAIPNSRITIAEALEKAEDARKSISNLHVTSDKPNVKERGTSALASQFISDNEIVDKRDKKSQDMTGMMPHSDTLETSRKKMKKLDAAMTSQSVTDGSPTSGATVNESASCSEGKTVSLAGKTKSPGTSRVQMTRRMWELLKFTFIHEHFPSSVHMARLAKMMGLPWAQVRNWFTDRRVDNKKAGIYPRDRPLIDCPYCDVTLQTEEQKSHLFSTQHVKNVLGSEYCGGGTSESIKWKKLPKTVNAVSRVSGARILAVGFSAEDFKNGKRVQEKKKMETTVSKVPPSKELKKLWTEAMLHPEDKEQPPEEWSPVRIGVEKIIDSNCDPFMQKKKEATFDLKMQEQNKKVSELKHHESVDGGKVVVSSRVVSIPVDVGVITPGSESDDFPVTVNNATTTTDMAVSSCDSGLVNKSVSAVMPGDLNIMKSHQTEDQTVISELESPRKIAAFAKKSSIDGMLESPTESQRNSPMFKEVPQKAYKRTVSNNMKPKKKPTSSGGSVNSYNISRVKKSVKSAILSSQYVQDLELKQECESDESWKNNITLYKSDDSSGQSKCEMAVVNVNKQPFTTSQSSALSGPNLMKSLQLQKTSSVAHDSSLVKSANKMFRTSVDKRKAKLRTQPLGSVLRANKATASPYEGNIIVGYQCPNCNKVYQTEWLMIKHSVTHFRYHCDICYQVYPTENMMKIHLLDHLSGAYEDEKYYCQFSCKMCHSLKCGCYEPTYCKPQDLPRIFFRPQKAKRSKKGFTSKPNSGPNDHLKISLSSYKKLLLSESLGNRIKEKSENSASPKPVLIEDAQKILLLKDDQKATSVGDSQISTFVLREAKISHTPAEPLKAHNVERENQEVISIKGETSHANMTKERGSDSIAGVSGEQSEVKPKVYVLEEKKQIVKKKQLNWRQIKRKLTLNYKSDVIPSPQSSCLDKLEETKETPGTKRAGSRRRTTKLSSNFIYKDTDFYYMCEICDASFSSKAELSEHMFLHRLKSRSRRGEKRGISCVTEDEGGSKKLKVHDQDKADTKTAESFENHSCELCHSTFTTIADYRAHKILAHKEPSSQNIEVFRCNYCDKIYRRRRELKRHLKRDCVSAPPSLKGKLSSLSCSTNMIEESHYTTVKVDLDDKPDVPLKFASKGATRGPIVCRYCLAVTKREAEMKRHIWKFCLKVPSEVVKKFMDGASLEELGFKFIRDKVSAEASPTDMPQNTHTDVSGTQNAGKDSLDEIQNLEFSKETNPESSPEKNTSLNVETSLQLELPEIASTTKFSLHMSPDKKISSIQEVISQDSNTARKETLIVQGDTLKNLNTSKPSLETETIHVQPVPSEEQSMSTVHAEDEESKKTEEDTELADKQNPAKLLSEEIKLESSCSINEESQSAASTSHLTSPVMQFPVVLPVMKTSAKSKRPLVCGYCGIWYFREMAILKHMKERCIKIPGFEKDILKNDNTLCNVSQKAGVGLGIVSENGAVYKMVKVPEHMQNTPVPMPKDVSNEDIKELNTNIKAYSEVTPTEAATPVDEQDNTSSVSRPVNQIRTSPSKRGSRCRRCHEHFTSQDALLAHSSVHHGPKKGFYKCKLCHARLVKYKQLREHVWEHTNESPYRCHLCEVKYRSSDVLVEHLQTQHQYTSINDKNLFKWLPGRHGKYRDIKEKNSNCEEKLDDVDTNLDSLAEVMVITDKDICSNTTTDSNLMEDENKVTKSYSGMHKYLDDSKNLKVDSICNENSSENSSKSIEINTVPTSSDIPSNTDCTVDDNMISEDVIADEMDNVAEGERNTVEECSGKESCGSLSVKNAVVQEESEEQTPAEPLACTKSENGLKEQNEVIIIEGNDVDKDAESGVVDGFTGEGLLPLIDNLDSVVETIQLTDKYLS